MLKDMHVLVLNVIVTVSYVSTCYGFTFLGMSISFFLALYGTFLFVR